MIRVAERTYYDRFEVSDMFHIAPRTLNWQVNNDTFPRPVRFGNRPYWSLATIVKYVDDLEKAA